ncbi:unnamed protein product [Soboliphyme baturini]|uniref:Protein polybromo-1 n=1 Tax=Soboliphyme baturini TaxID=241478 RepID=A0A183IBX9_9BILA|nr:unnamed protein product [Soboliphyme baturini]
MSYFMINKKLKNNEYVDLASFLHDFSLMFSNAKAYNIEGSDIYVSEDGRWLAEAFVEKPSKKMYPDYYQVIPEPIDLKMIRSNIDNDKYPSTNVLAADFDLMFSNARHYNEENSKIYDDANTLDALFKHVRKQIGFVESPAVARERNSSRRSGAIGLKELMATSRGRSGSYSSDTNSYSGRKAVCGSFASSDKLWKLFLAIKNYADSKSRILSSIFLKLPSKNDYPDYYEVIKKPIDLQKIHSRLSNGQYENLDALVADFALMFDNACKYNDPDSRIYKDALTLQRVLLQKKSELQENELLGKVIDVQSAVQELLARIFITVYNHQDEDGRCYSDSLAEVQESALHSPSERMPTTLDQIKKNLDKVIFTSNGCFFSYLIRFQRRYKRLDCFQNDMFHVLNRAKNLSSVESQVYEDACELMYSFVKTRDELCKNGEWFSSPCFSVTERDEGDTEVRSIEVNGRRYAIGDFIYVKPTEENLSPHIMHLQEIWMGTEKGKCICVGNWYFRPYETFHLATRKFLEKVLRALFSLFLLQEVFRTDFYDKIDPSRIMGRCYVMFVKDFFQCRAKVRVSKFFPLHFNMPTHGFEDKDIYVCESKYLGRVRHFKKLKSWDLGQHENTVEFEERSVPLQPTRVPSVFVTESRQIPSASETKEDMDYSTIDVERSEVLAKTGISEQQQEYEQLCYNGSWYKLGDFVYISSDKALPDILRIERLWKSEGEPLISGTWFLRPDEVDHEPTRLFYKKELFAIDRNVATTLAKVTGRCAVLTYRDYCRSKLIFDGHFLKLYLIFKLSADVVEDEVYYFKKQVTPEKEASPFLMKRDLSYDPAADINETSTEIESSETSILKGIHITPKLTARSKSGYILFSAVVRKRIMAENPECSFGDISKIVGSEWKKLSEEDKKRYEEEAQRIAEERMKADAAKGGRFHLLPGQIRVYCCRWKDCDYQFEALDQLNEHITNCHTSQIVECGDNQFVCLWQTCAKYRKEGKPFPSLPRLHRHIKEKHLPTAVKCMYPPNKSRHYVPLSAPFSPGSSCLNNSQNSQGSTAVTPQSSPQVQISTSTPGQQTMCFQQSSGQLTTGSSHVLVDSQGNVIQNSSVLVYQVKSPAHPPMSQMREVTPLTPVSQANPPAPILTDSTFHGVDPGRCVVQSFDKPQPVFVSPPPQRIRRVLHSQSYLKYSVNFR